MMFASWQTEFQVASLSEGLLTENLALVLPNPEVFVSWPADPVALNRLVTAEEATPVVEFPEPAPNLVDLRKDGSDAVFAALPSIDPCDTRQVVCSNEVAVLSEESPVKPTAPAAELAEIVADPSEPALEPVETIAEESLKTHAENNAPAERAGPEAPVQVEQKAVEVAADVGTPEEEEPAEVIAELEEEPAVVVQDASLTSGTAAPFGLPGPNGKLLSLLVRVFAILAAAVISINLFSFRIR
jgi:hypothetical protein